MSIFSRFARKEKRDRTNVTPYNIQVWRYSRFDRNILQMDTIRASIDALARNIAKTNLQVVRHKPDGTKDIETSSDVSRVLNRPNPYMSTYDFLYKIAAQFYSNNNAFIWPEYKDGKLVAMWPINYSSFHLLNRNGNLYAQFVLTYTRTYTVPYEDVIHLRNHFMTDDLQGDANDAIAPVCELVNAQNQGIIEGIKNSALIRGILKTAQVIKEEDLQKKRDKFVKDNLSASNNGGVMVVDGKFDYQNIESKPYVVDADTQKVSKERIYDYFGVNEKFITNEFSSAEYEAVYEGRLEPFAIMLTQALTAGLLPAGSIARGCEVEANLSKLKYQPMSIVSQMIGMTNQVGLFRKNEYREMLGYPPLPDEDGGNDILVSLNYTNRDDLSEVQTGDKNDGTE